MRAAIASTALALLVAGCAALGPAEVEELAPSVAPGSQAAASTETLLRYFQNIRKLAAAEFGREHETVRRAYARGRSDMNRMRLAMVLSLPNTAFNDEARALELLEPLMRNSRSGLHGLALMMGTYLQEQRRLGGSVQSMQQKLEDLKSLERSLIERERSGAAKR